jgi:hypothetical protein
MTPGARTFGELLLVKKFRHYARCSFCKTERHDTIRYSTRHSVCVPCGQARADVVLPAVKKRERFEARLAAIRAEAEKVQP